VAAAYLVLYGIGRFLIEFLRDDYRGSIGIFSTSQIISFGIVALGIALYFVIPKVTEKKAA
jgi:phosphatidylglycerol:prolipoprotein diacylglycerol transferase